MFGSSQKKKSAPVQEGPTREFGVQDALELHRRDAVKQKVAHALNPEAEGYVRTHAACCQGASTVGSRVEAQTVDLATGGNPAIYSIRPVRESCWRLGLGCQCDVKSNRLRSELALARLR